ncbi:MAG: carboxypeptidase-like regulatory domain-containing protein [Mycobacteriales bacterium]
MTDQTPDPATEPDARRGAVRARRRLVRTGTIMAVMALGAGGGVAAAAGAGDLLAPAGPLTSATQSLPGTGSAVSTVHNHLGQLQGLVGGAQAVPMRDNANPAGELTGKVTDLSGNPLSGIGLYKVSHQAVQLVGHTDDDGTFKIECPGGPVLLSSTGLSNSDGSPTDPGKLAYQFLGGVSTLAAAPVPLCRDNHPYRAEMAPAGEITGVLRDAAGNALPNTPLTLANTEDPHGFQVRTMSDRQGRYLFSGLPAGRYQTLAGSNNPLGPVSNVTAGLPVVKDLVATVRKAAEGVNVGNGLGDSLPGGLGGATGSANMMRGIAGAGLPGVGNLPIDAVPTATGLLTGALPVGSLAANGLLPH